MQLSSLPSKHPETSSHEKKFQTISSSLLQGFNYGQTELKQDIGKMKPKKNRNIATGHVYKCEVCSRVYASQGNLRRHLNYECNKKPQFECPVCKNVFQHRHSAKIHYNQTHQDHIKEFGNWFQQESERKIAEKKRRSAARKISDEHKQTNVGGAEEMIPTSQMLNMSTSPTTRLEASDSTPHPSVATAELSLTSVPIQHPSLYAPHHADVKPFLGRVAPGIPSSGGGDPR